MVRSVAMKKRFRMRVVVWRSKLPLVISDVDGFAEVLLRGCGLMQVTAFERDWLRNENVIIPLPVLLGTGSYTILSSIPVPAFPEGG